MSPRFSRKQHIRFLSKKNTTIKQIFSLRAKVIYLFFKPARVQSSKQSLRFARKQIIHFLIWKESRYNNQTNLHALRESGCMFGTKHAKVPNNLSEMWIPSSTDASNKFWPASAFRELVFGSKFMNLWQLLVQFWHDYMQIINTWSGLHSLTSLLVGDSSKFG